MTLAFLSELGRNLLFRTLVATAAVFLFLGFATGALPVKCLTEGLTSCGAVPSVAPKSAEAAAPPRLPTASQQPVQVAVVDSSPTLTDNAVITDSFALLHFDPTPQTALATSWKSTAAADDNELTSRTVKTVAIHADGTPDVEVASAPQVPETPATDAKPTEIAEASPVTLPRVDPLVAPASDDAEAAIDAAAPSPVATKPAPIVQKLALVEETPPVKPKKTTSSKYATVTGQGANVHSSDKSASSVVFALAGGSRVTVLESSHGWIHITDAKGRSGWMYKDYLS